jgi:uncharacterized protein (DUF488 family)
MSAEDSKKVFTIGHSTLSIEAFLRLLRGAGVTAVADVRSFPFSRRVPHFNRDKIRVRLKENGIKYAFLGKELGGRPHASHLYNNGVADYEKMALEPAFLEGIDRIIAGSEKHTIALMCSEHNPLDCHRCLLVGRVLSDRKFSLEHILSSGKIADQHDVENKLLSIFGDISDDMFLSREERLVRAYRLRARNVAYREPRIEMDESAMVDGHDHAF